MYSSNIRVEWDEPPVGRAYVVNKKIWNPETQEFEPRVFIRVHCDSKDLQRESEWMAEQFGPPKYQGHWWWIDITNDLWMSDSLATFWYLKHGK